MRSKTTMVFALLLALFVGHLFLGNVLSPQLKLIVRPRNNQSRSFGTKQHLNLLSDRAVEDLRWQLAWALLRLEDTRGGTGLRSKVGRLLNGGEPALVWSPFLDHPQVVGKQLPAETNIPQSFHTLQAAGSSLQHTF